MRLLIVISILVAVACGDAQAPPRSAYDPQGGLEHGPGKLRGHNVLLISIDTLRADRLGCYGYKAPTTPMIDALARDGVVFEHAISSSPWTTPAHISMMTSLYAESHGVYAYPKPGVLDPKVVTLAEILRAQGWRTAGFTEGGYAKGGTGLAHGFEEFPSWPHDEEGFISHELDPSRLIENAVRARSWLDEHGHERFFLFFHTYEPHFEYQPPAQFLAEVAPWLDLASENEKLAKAIATWNQGRALSAGQKGVLIRHQFQGDLHSNKIRHADRLLSMLGSFSEKRWSRSPTYAADLRYLNALYDAEVRFADEVIGSIVSKLEEMDLLEETLVIVASDHGEGLMERGVLQHGIHMHTELLHVPLVVRFPERANAQVRYSGQVRSVDILPTILDWIGLPVPHQAQGQSLLSLLGRGGEGLSAFAQGVVVSGGETDLRMYSQGRWKFLHDSRTGVEALFDVEADPRELVNVIAKADPQLVADLRKALEGVDAENRARAAMFDVAPGELSEREIERLEALGYVIE